MKTKSVLFISILMSCIMSWFFTRFYYISVSEFRLEKVVGAEIKFLEEVKGYAPPCDKLRREKDLVYEKQGTHIIIWRLTKELSEIEKVVINDDFYSVYEKVENVCN